MSHQTPAIPRRCLSCLMTPILTARCQVAPRSLSVLSLPVCANLRALVTLHAAQGMAEGSSHLPSQPYSLRARLRSFWPSKIPDPNRPAVTWPDLAHLAGSMLPFQLLSAGTSRRGARLRSLKLP